MHSITNANLEDGLAIHQSLIPDHNGDYKRSITRGVARTADFIDSFIHKSRKRTKSLNPIAPNAADLVNWVVYDRFSVASNTAIGANWTWFNQPIGTNNKTKIDTNLEQVMGLPAPLWMNVFGVGFQFNTTTLKADVDTVLDNYFMEFWVSQKTYLEGPYECFPGAAGIAGNPSQGVTTQTAAGAAVVSTLSAWTIGTPQQGNFFDLRLPHGIVFANGQQSDGLTGVTILQGQTFQVKSIAPGGSQSTANPGNGLKMRCYLYGVLSRGVQ